MSKDNFLGWGLLSDLQKGYYFEFVVERLIGALIHTGQTCVDVGVNFGAHTWTMLQACGESGKVVGFEPNPVCLDALMRWPQWDANLVVHAVALSDHEGLSYLLSDESMQISTLHHEIQARAGLSPTRSFPVKLATLDSYVLPSCDLMKIDVDGEELRCLKGGRSMIARLRPPIVVEVSWELFSPGEIAELDSWLTSISYEMRNLFDGQVLTASRGDHWMVALWPHELDARPFIDVVSASGRSFLYEHPHWNHYSKFTTDSSI